jgi:CheY-like chemotaxis protein
MPDQPLLRALVVDDEMIVRRLVARALSDQGFTCELAADGEEAADKIAVHKFDLLVTDLKMPNRHGHALVRDVLQVDSHPVIIVHTGVLEPKLAVDLLARGVNDLIYKPTDVNLLAAKARVLVDRQRQLADSTRASAALEQSLSLLSAAPAPIECEGTITTDLLNSKLANVSSVLPISNAAIDVYHMTRTCDWRLSQIAAAIQRDAALSAEVLRLANSSLYNPSSQKVVSLDQAVMAIGQKRIGELAITVNALAAVTPATIPWLDLDLAWLRSMAAGVAIEELIEVGKHERLEEGLALSATLYPLSRVVLGAMFPRLYERMISEAWQKGETLHDQERRVLPVNHSAVLAQLLMTWRIPVDVAQPLRYVADDFIVLGRLAEPLRTKAELMKLAIVLGRLAIERWETWDTVELPPAATLKRLGVVGVESIVARIRSEVEKLAGFAPGRTAARKVASKTDYRSIAYCNLGNDPCDLLRELLPSLGLSPVSISPEELRSLDLPVVVNGLEAPATRLVASRTAAPAWAVTTRERADGFSTASITAALPCSFGRLRDSLTDFDRAQAAPARSANRASGAPQGNELEGIVGCANGSW